jgi:hypothetical protein
MDEFASKQAKETASHPIEIYSAQVCDQAKLQLQYLFRAAASSKQQAASSKQQQIWYTVEEPWATSISLL